MAKFTSKDGIKLRRTAAEIKRYRLLTKLLPAIAGLIAIIVAIAYIVSILYNKYGSFTVMVNKFDSTKYAISLSETPDFLNPTMRLNSKASEEVTNISVKDLPDNLNNLNGEHNGDNYVAYTFYLKNRGTEEITVEYELYIANITLDLDEAVRVRLYLDEEYDPENRENSFVDYAKTRSDGKGAEEGTTEFYSETVITKARFYRYKPEQISKFTVVIWIEGDDPDCIDNKIGGQFKIDMAINILTDENTDSSSSSSSVK